MKVKGFQVAPAELEGHLLDHPQVDDACVVGVPDDYSGEVPFAFVMLEPKAASRAKDPKEAENIRASIFKASTPLDASEDDRNSTVWPYSMSPMRKYTTSGLRVGSSSST